MRIVVVGSLAYVSLVLIVNMSIKRTLAQLNAFDFIITVALGASFGRILTARQVALAEAVTTFALLVILQFVFTWLQQRSPRIASAVTAAPSLLFYQGQFIRDAMRRERVTEAELKSAVRLQGAGAFEKIEAIILEPNGKFSVVKKESAGDGALVEKLDPPSG
ncbi:DUF421 domain-containing protein [Marinimicrobium sp. ABcell2]|uniref:DUF421 domain-containing protein n=1 Tax=Marinimicrobium sp. ABcell2 TaxID=3069751 RepID=UPI0027B3EC2F|nr:YetF domain-containing protein [Marinimicrobium sp. ABcell2]MDQ2076758.1 DUF421 domain-containing protein [Marinimicrobium sp. ABcell2]